MILCGKLKYIFVTFIRKSFPINPVITGHDEHIKVLFKLETTSVKHLHILIYKEPGSVTT